MQEDGITRRDVVRFCSVVGVIILIVAGREFYLRNLKKTQQSCVAAALESYKQDRADHCRAAGKEAGCALSFAASNAIEKTYRRKEAECNNAYNRVNLGDVPDAVSP